METRQRIATNARERWSLLITGEHGQDLTTRERCVGLRVALASTDKGTCERFELERIAKVEGITTTEVRAILRRLHRQHWIGGDLDGFSTEHEGLELTVPWWSLSDESYDDAAEVFA